MRTIEHTTIPKVLLQYRDELQNELQDILMYWINNTIDNENGGFIGRIGHFNQKFPQAPKGAVLNSRILWTFSSAYRLTGNLQYKEIAGRAFHYISDKFIDHDHGGVYWTVDYKGHPLDTKKQIYALAFALYGFSEFYKISSDKKALQLSTGLYEAIVKHSYDEKNGGYIEALSREWKELGDLRLSTKDANERKSMNTHLHVLEGFANLYSVWPDEGLHEKLKELVLDFGNHILDGATGHLHLFFDDNWQSRSHLVSYGHDIEAAWLILEAVEILGDKNLSAEWKTKSFQLAEAAARGLDTDGGLWYEYDPQSDHLNKEKHSWPQAEAMVGFFNAWEITGNESFLQHSLASWKFVKKYILDGKEGEWLWGVHEDYSAMSKEDKVGIWKCPYHNSRACMELVQRINRILKLQNDE